MVYGNPRISVRMPEAVIKALKHLAAKKNKTPSDILRDLTIDALMREGCDVAEERETANA